VSTSRHLAVETGLRVQIDEVIDTLSVYDEELENILILLFSAQLKPTSSIRKSTNFLFANP